MPSPGRIYACGCPWDSVRDAEREFIRTTRHPWTYRVLLAMGKTWGLCAKHEMVMGDLVRVWLAERLRESHS